MRYQIIKVESEPLGRLIKFLDLTDGTVYFYYLQEIPHIKLPRFKSFILPYLKDIRAGKYDA